MRKETRMPDCMYDYRYDNTQDTAEEQETDTCVYCGEPVNKNGVHLLTDMGEYVCSDCIAEFVYENFVSGGTFKDYVDKVNDNYRKAVR